MYKTHREDYEKYWDDINPFIKFGCLKDLKFLDKMKDFCIYKNLEGKYITLPEYLEAGKEKYENKVFYVTDEQAQSQYINMFKAEVIRPVAHAFSMIARSFSFVQTGSPFTLHVQAASQSAGQTREVNSGKQFVLVRRRYACS